MNRYALDGSFNIFFFLGDFDPDHSGWFLEHNLATASSVFASTSDTVEEGHCSNCEQKKASGLKYYDTVGLTQALLTYWKSGEQVHGLGVGDLRPESVVPFLTRNLHWRIADVSIMLQKFYKILTPSVGEWGASRSRDRAVPQDNGLLRNSNTPSSTDRSACL